MKIMHLNLYLPDHRIEKEAYLAKKAGCKVSFVGEVSNTYQMPKFEKKLFENIFNVKITPKNKLGFNLKPLIKKISLFIRDNDFDVIHASNVYCVIIADKLGLPVLFDDHEFYSFELPYLKSSRHNFKEFIAHTIMKFKYPRYEKNIVKKWPLLTVSKEIIKMYKKIESKTDGYYFPNMPLLEEIPNFPMKSKTTNDLRTMYVGLNDFTHPISYRNTTGLLSMWNESKIGKLMIIGDKFLKNSKNVSSLGFVTQEKIFDQLQTGHLGLVGWLPHPYHKICSLNKIYNYIHSGLEIIYPSSLIIGKEISEVYSNEFGFKFGFEFKEFSQIKEFILHNKESLLQRDFKAISTIAKKHFILNNYQDNLIKAYKKAIEKAN